MQTEVKIYLKNHPMLFLSLFLFAVENLVQKDMGFLNLNSVPDSSASFASASPARGTHYTAFLQKEPPALSLVAKSANSEEEAKKLLEKVGNVANFSALQKVNLLDAQIVIAEYGKFTIMDSKITNGKFDGYYRVQDDKSKIYNLVVQNVSNLGILKSFMAELLKAYIDRNKIFKEFLQSDVTPKKVVSNSSAQQFIGDAASPLQLEESASKLEAAKTIKDLKGLITVSEAQGLALKIVQMAAVEQKGASSLADLEEIVKDLKDLGLEGPKELTAEVASAVRTNGETGDVSHGPARSEASDSWWLEYQYGVPAVLSTFAVCYGLYRVFFCPEFSKIKDDVLLDNLSCLWGPTDLEAAKKVWEVCLANASSTNAFEVCPAGILPQELKSIAAPLLQPQLAPLALPAQVIQNATKIILFAFCWANRTMLRDPLTPAQETSFWGALAPEVNSVVQLAQGSSGKVPPKLSFTETCQAFLYTWFCWFTSLLG